MTQRLKRKLILFWRGWGFSVVIAIVIATSFKSAIADWNVVPTGSMKPTIVEGDRILVNKLAYDLKIPYTTWHIAEWCQPERGDIVVFYSPANGKRLVKRVVGLPGDTVAMLNNTLSINGRFMEYHSIPPPHNGIDTDHQCFRENLYGTEHAVMIVPKHSSVSSFGPIWVPKGKYFVMGDNRNNSMDSRYFGFVDRRQILGQATAVVASMDKSNNYTPRWERFFTRLP
jgi:signal peptidase I